MIVNVLPGIHSASIVSMRLFAICVSKVLILGNVLVLVVAHCMRMGA